MSSKVIKWFKRQASVRRHLEKKDDKTPQGDLDEKRKTSFPRLSFRKKNHKKKSGSISESEAPLTVVPGLSKKLSLSVPKEMESNAKDKVPNLLPKSNSSMSPESLPNSPCKSYRSTPERSYNSSIDYSRDTNESLSLGEKDNTSMSRHNDPKCTSDVSKPSNQHTFHSVNSSLASITRDTSSFYSTDRGTTTTGVYLQDNAPIVKMEEICDNVSDKEHPEEEIQSVASSVTSAMEDDLESTEHRVSDSDSSRPIRSDKLETNSYIKVMEDVEDPSSNSLRGAEGNRDTSPAGLMESVAPVPVVSVPREPSSFDEIDRLVRDAARCVEQDNEEDAPRDPEISSPDQFSLERRDEESPMAVESDREIDLDQNCEDEIPCPQNDPSSSPTRLTEDSESLNPVEVAVEDISEPLPTDGLINSAPIPADERENSEEEIHPKGVPPNEETPLENDLSASPEAVKTINNNIDDAITSIGPTSHETKLRLLNLNSASPGSGLEESPIKIVLTTPSPVKQPEEAVPIAAGFEDSPLSHHDRYPRELNPFGEDDNDSDDDRSEIRPIITSSTTSRCRTTENGISKENEISKENGRFKGHTSEDSKTHSHRPSTQRFPAPRSEANHHTIKEYKKGGYDKLLNPFGDSDGEEERDALSSPNPFEEEEEGPKRRYSEGRPNLPPKSVDTQRKMGRGFLAPVPHPRKSKQSHHGSYISLQNFPITPTPAPRSITPFGSTKALDTTPITSFGSSKALDTTPITDFGSTKALESTPSFNPFDDEEPKYSFERQSLTRSSLQVSTQPSTPPEPFARSFIRGSLPPSSSSKVFLAKKKRQAPLPPGFSNNKLPESPSNFFRSSRFPRQRSSTSPECMNLAFNKDPPPHSRSIGTLRMAPPRPPPPKIN